MIVDFGSESIMYLQMLHLLKQATDTAQNMMRRRNKKISFRKCYRIDWSFSCTIEENYLLLPAIALENIGCLRIKRNNDADINEMTYEQRNKRDRRKIPCTSVNLYLNPKGLRLLVTSIMKKDIITKMFSKDKGLIMDS